VRIDRFICVVVAITLCVQCGNAADDAVVAAKARVRDTIWQYHIAIIKATVAARSQRDVTIDLKEFGRAVDAIELLTKIPSNTGTRVGRLPTPELPRTIQMWEQWYADHRGNVDIDVGGCSLRLKK
jgi:hypothetical protein